MAGVIEDKGVQWEHCDACGESVRLDNLGYQPKSRANPYGRDLCMSCVNKLSHWHMARVTPAASWLAVRSEKGGV